MRDNQSALRAVRAIMADKAWSAGRLAKESGVSENTIRTFLAGRSWPVMATLGKLEKALGWPAGRLEDIALGVHLEESATEPPKPTTPPAQPPPITAIEHRGWRVTIQASPDATPEQVRKAESALLDTALTTLRELGLEDA